MTGITNYGKFQGKPILVKSANTGETTSVGSTGSVPEGGSVTPKGSLPPAENPNLKQNQKAFEDYVTASWRDVLKSKDTNGEVVITEDDVVNLEDGVTEFTVDGSEVTIFKNGRLIQSQVYGEYRIKLIKDFLVNNIIKPTPFTGENEGTNGVNGEIDESVSQGGTGDCWVISAVLALNSTEIGRQIIKESITSNADGSVTVTFKGLNVSYTISADEIKKHDTDNKSGDAYSNGDNDMLVLELAVKLLMKDIASGKVKTGLVDNDANAFENYFNRDGSFEGGFESQMIYYMTGKTSDDYYAEWDGYNIKTGYPAETINQILEQGLNNPNAVLTFGLYHGVHTATCVDGTPFRIDLGDGGHAFAITEVTENTVTFVNPWNSEKKYTMTWEEFAKLGIGMISIADISDVETNGPAVDPTNPTDPTDPTNPTDPTEPVDPVDPTNPTDPVEPVEPDNYSIEGLVAQGFTKAQIAKYFEISEDGQYKMRDDITYNIVVRVSKGFRRETVTIKTLEELKEFCGTESRLKLRNEGFTDELIDKFFSLFTRNGKSACVLNNKEYSRYEVTNLEDGSKKIILTRRPQKGRDMGFVEIIVKSDGSYTVTDHQPSFDNYIISFRKK